MDLKDLMHETRESLSEFLERSYWVEDRVFVHTTKAKTALEKVIGLDEARSYAQGLLDDVELPRSIPEPPKSELCPQNNLLLFEELGVDGKRICIKTQCTFCGEEFGEMRFD